MSTDPVFVSRHAYAHSSKWGHVLRRWSGKALLGLLGLSVTAQSLVAQYPLGPGMSGSPMGGPPAMPSYGPGAGMPAGPMYSPPPNFSAATTVPQAQGSPRILTPQEIPRSIPGPLASTNSMASNDHRIEAMPTQQQKLEITHHRSQLVITRKPIRRMSWSDPAIIDIVQYSPTEIDILGTSLGVTDLKLWFEGSDEPLMYAVTTIRDSSLEEQRRIDYGKIERKLQLLYPNSKVYLIPMSRQIVVRGQARDPEESARIMQIVRSEVQVQDSDFFGRGNGAYGLGYGGGGGGGAGFIDPNLNGGGGGGFGNQNGFGNGRIVDELVVPGEYQIMVRVRIAQIQRSQLRRLGIDFNVLFNDARHIISSTALAVAPTLSGVFEAGQITVLIDALASNGTVKILEDATLTTMSGQPAAFLSGGEFAVPTLVGINGIGGQTTTFRGFGTSIIATPTMIDNDLIRLQIVPELSEINSGNTVGGIPGTNVRRVQTRVELREGQTIVLGGLFSRRTNTETTRIPLLGEIPLIGDYLFNTKKATEDENELLIIVTPEIVRPVDADQAPPLPGWYVTHPDDFDLYRYNRTEGNPDLGHYQLLPFGNGQGPAQDVGYNFYNPPPAGGPSPNQVPQGGPGPGFGPGGPQPTPMVRRGYPSPNTQTQTQMPVSGGRQGVSNANRGIQQASGSRSGQPQQRYSGGHSPTKQYQY